MIGSYASGLLIVTPLVSMASDHYQVRKLPLLLGPVLLFVASLCFMFGNSLSLLFLGRIGQGIGGGISWTLGFTMLADVFSPNELGAPMGKVFSANTFGFLIGPPIGGLVYDWFGEEYVFALCGLIVLVTFFIALVFVPDTLQAKKQDEDVQETRRLLSSAVVDEDAASCITEESDSSSSDYKEVHQRKKYGSFASSTGVSHVSSGMTVRNDQEERQSLDLVEEDLASDRSRNSPGVIDWDIRCAPSEDGMESLSDTSRANIRHDRSLEPSLLNLMTEWEVACTTLSVVLSATVFTLLEPVLPIYLARAFNASSSQIGFMWSAMMIPNFFFSQWAGEWSDKYGRKNITTIGLFIFALACPMVALAPTPLLCVLALTGVGIGQAVAMTPCLPEMAEFVEAKGGGRLYAQMYALFNVADALGMCVGPMLGGILFQTGGIQLVTFSSCGVLAFTGLMVGCTYMFSISKSRERSLA